MIFPIKFNRKNKNQIKPRETSVYLDMGKPVRINKVGITKNGELILKNDDEQVVPEKAFIETSYSRENPKKLKKILNKINLNPQQLVVAPNRAFYKYDVIFAVDTNTEKLNDKTVSVCCAIISQIKKGSEYDMALFRISKVIEFWNISKKPELVALTEIIKMITANPDYNENRLIGIIVDTELNSLAKINNREVPILDNIYLPQGFELIYASADVGKENLPNILISNCDKTAKDILGLIKNNIGDPADVALISNMPFTHRRYWEKG